MLRKFHLSPARVLLFSILVFSFTYRLLLVLWAKYPAGADIGLHNSVINSITGSGNIDFLHNNYQMGGGLSLTFPGYHIFVSCIIFLTGITDYVAHSLIVSLFSTLVVAIAFLMTRKFWGLSTAFIVAFLVAVSRFDIEMLLWGGYPNVITLALIPLVFYLYLQKERFSLFPFLSVGTLLVGAIYLTHSLSAVVFVSLLLSFIIFGSAFSRKVGLKLKQLALWLLPVFLGGIVVSPFLVHAVPAYLGANSETIIGGVVDIREALLSTRILPAEILVPICVSVIFFFLFSKEYKGKFLTVHSLLLTLWILVPIAFTQGYFVGLFTDYNRFLYFVLFPLIILIGMVVDHSSRLLSQIAHAYLLTPREKLQPWRAIDQFENRLKPYMNRKNLYSGFLLTLLLSLFFAVPLLLTPWEGTRIQGFYQVMSDSGYDAIKWAGANTPQGSNFISDALYGWWLGGFAERPTISAVDPQYLTLSRELDPAKNASYLLDTDYVIDNDLIQVREDGGYLGRHNPMFLGKLNWTYFPYPFFNFNNDDATISLSYGGDLKFFDLTQLSVMEMKLENNSDLAKISVLKGNNFVNFTQTLTVYRNRRFVNMSIVIDSVTEGVSLLTFNSIMHIRGDLINKTDYLGMFEEGSKVLGQVIYAENHPEEVKLITAQNPSGLGFVYNLHGDSSAALQLFISVFPVSDSPDKYRDIDAWENPYLNEKLDDNLKGYLGPVDPEWFRETYGEERFREFYNEEMQSMDLPFVVFDYRKAMVDLDISYIACRDFSVFSKFDADPSFSTVFINEEVAVFKVKSSFS